MSRDVEIAVVGAGPGGLSAALAAARLGAQVTVLDAYPEPGGQYYHQPPEWQREQATRRQKHGWELWQHTLSAGVEILSERLVWNINAQQQLSLTGPDGIEQLHAEALILATGAYERPAVFPGWTLPGVITAGAAQTLLYHRVRPGRRVLIAGTGPLQLVTAAHLIKAGIDVVGVLEGSNVVGKSLEHTVRNAGAIWGQWERLGEGTGSLIQLLRHGSVYRTGWGIIAAHGRDQVEGATIARLDADWRPIPGTEQKVACDTICVGYGLVPFNGLAKLAGAEQEWRADLGGETPKRDPWFQTTIRGIFAVGDGAGIGGYHMAMLEGRTAGCAAARQLGHEIEKAAFEIRALQPALRKEAAFQRLYADLFTPGPGIFELAQADTPICRCEGVTQGQLDDTIRAGAGNVTEVKNLTRCGMGECQGRMCGQHVTQTLARMTGKTVELIGGYSARPPLFSLPIGNFISSE